ncbi:MAG: hypothetical protein IKM85_03540 [Bacteroidales bacterium]|nr:hypothetical protein [Bacteroidales bacterium]
MAKIANLFDNQGFSSKKIACNYKKEAAQKEAAPGLLNLVNLAEDYGVAKVGNNQIHATITEVMRAEKDTHHRQAEQPDYIDPDPLDWYELDSLSAKPPKKAPKTTKQPYSPRWKKGGRHYGQ